MLLAHCRSLKVVRKALHSQSGACISFSVSKTLFFPYLKAVCTAPLAMLAGLSLLNAFSLFPGALVWSCVSNYDICKSLKPFL